MGVYAHGDARVRWGRRSYHRPPWPRSDRPPRTGNTTCPKKTFAEQVPGLTVRYQRRTPQLQRLVEDVGVMLAAEAAVTLASLLMRA